MTREARRGRVAAGRHDMRRLLIIAAAALTLSACQTTEEMLAQDETYCERLGARAGTSVFVQCMMAREGQRIEARQRAAQAFSVLGQQLSQPQPQQQPVFRHPMNCTTYRAGQVIQTRCF